MYDDPNKVQEVENIIIDFYNRMKRGSSKRGLETPRCGFLLSCNFSLGKIQRCDAWLYYVTINYNYCFQFH